MIESGSSLVDTNQLLDVLSQLIACDSQNPPREISPDSALIQIVRDSLGHAFRFEVFDYGKGRVNLLAMRGNPDTLFNVHLDTVPVGGNWTFAPLQATVSDGRVFGRGVCDIKGAAACLISSALTCDDDVAILFSTDEEGTESCCVQEFCKSTLATSFSRFIVAEPTECRAVTGHRGYLSVRETVEGRAGHTSQHHLLTESANHRAANWIVEMLQQVARFEKDALNGGSACFNVGRIDGGIKNNMVSDQCLVTWSARLPANGSNQEMLDWLSRSRPEFVSWEISFNGDPLPGSDSGKTQANEFCKRASLAIGADVDFWTEAAIFSATGNPTLVLGPGNIQQAHTPDEWVAIEQLEKCASIYRSLMIQNRLS